MIRRICLLLPLLWAVCAGESHAASSGWAEQESARLRLVTGERADGKNVLDATLQFELAPGWHTYWRNPGDAGMPVTVDSSASRNVGSVELLFPAPTRLLEVPPEGGAPLESFGYEGAVAFPLRVTLADAAQETTLDLAVNYVVCSDICIAYNDRLTLTVPADYVPDSADAGIVSLAQARVPEANGGAGMSISMARVGPETLEVVAQAEHEFAQPDLFVEEDVHCCRYPKPEVSLTNGGKTATFRFAYQPDSKGEQPTGPLKFTLTDGEHAVEATLPLGALPAAPPLPVALVLLFALLGGLILNVMPCVLPVLSLKVLSVVKHGTSASAVVRRGFLASAAGIVFSFMVLAGGAVLLKAAGMSVGWGFQFQEPTFLIALAIILVLFASNLWGHFEIRLPAWLGGALSGSNASGDDHSLAGHFTTGAFATLLATPCSAPFLGTAIGFALSQGTAEILLTFCAMGVGMALPYLLVAAFPATVKFFPKPGHWMVTVKHVMGLLLAATALWLLWVLSHQIGEAGAILVALLVGSIFVKLWLFGNHPRLGRKHILMPLIALLAFVAFMVPARVEQVGIAPQAVDEAWQPFDEMQIVPLVAQGKVVLVDVTADWCLTCKVNKLAVLDAGDVRALFADNNVVLMKADLTSPDATITAFLNSHGRYGIPFNIIFGPNAPDGIALSELLTKDAVKDAVAKAKK
ncbi:MAG: thioredoxin family protein [Alphaproteobacteria bacterium]|nr:thioredoxin family protein [Alphaproteobacteria bacterium]